MSYVTGRAYFPAGSYATLLAVTNQIYATPFMAVGGGLSFDRIGLNVTVAGAGAAPAPVARLGVYEDENGVPGRLVSDFGATAALTGTGEYSITINPADKPMLWPNRRYWLAAVFNTAETTMPTCAAIATAAVAQGAVSAIGAVSLATMPSSIATAAVGLRGAYTYAALPSHGSSVTWTAQLNANVIYVGMRAA